LTGLRADPLDGRLMAGIELVRGTLPHLGDGDQRLGQLGEIERDRCRPLPQIDGADIAQALHGPPPAARQLELDVTVKEGQLVAVRRDDRVRAPDAAMDANRAARQGVALGQVSEIAERDRPGSRQAATGAGVGSTAPDEKGSDHEANASDGHDQQRNGGVAHGAKVWGTWLVIGSVEDGRLNPHRSTTAA
jgi:hypothetical protein